MDDLREKVIREIEKVLEIADQYDGLMIPVFESIQAFEDALSLLKAQEQKTAYWIHCNGKSNIFYCSHCAEKINYNNAHRVYNKDMKPVEQINRFCRGCGYAMIPMPTDAQREAVKWDE